MLFDKNVEIALSPKKKLSATIQNQDMLNKMRLNYGLVSLVLLTKS